MARGSTSWSTWIASNQCPEIHAAKMHESLPQWHGQRACLLIPNPPTYPESRSQYSSRCVTLRDTNAHGRIVKQESTQTKSKTCGSFSVIDNVWLFWHQIGHRCMCSGLFNCAHLLAPSLLHLSTSVMPSVMTQFVFLDQRILPATLFVAILGCLLGLLIGRGTFSRLNFLSLICERSVLGCIGNKGGSC